MRKDESGSRNKTQTNVKSFAVTQQKSKEAKPQLELSNPGTGPQERERPSTARKVKRAKRNGSREAKATTRRHNVVFVAQFLLSDLLLHV